MADDTSIQVIEEDEAKCILCIDSDPRKDQACGKLGTRLCRPIYVIFNIFTCTLIVHMIGFSSAYWSYGEGFYHNGLWMLCGLNQQQTCRYLPYNAAWFEATQALETLGLFAAFLGLILLILFIFHSQSTSNRAIFVMVVIATFVAAIFTSLGIVIYGAKNRDLSWSYGLTVLAGTLYFTSGVLMVLHLNLNLRTIE